MEERKSPRELGALLKRFFSLFMYLSCWARWLPAVSTSCRRMNMR